MCSRVHAVHARCDAPLHARTTRCSSTRCTCPPCTVHRPTHPGSPCRGTSQAATTCQRGAVRPGICRAGRHKGKTKTRGSSVGSSTRPCVLPSHAKLSVAAAYARGSSSPAITSAAGLGEAAGALSIQHATTRGAPPSAHARQGALPPTDRCTHRLLCARGACAAGGQQQHRQAARQRQACGGGPGPHGFALPACSAGRAVVHVSVLGGVVGACVCVWLLVPQNDFCLCLEGGGVGAVQVVL